MKVKLLSIIHPVLSAGFIGKYQLPVLSLLAALFFFACSKSPDTIDLSGEWNVALDSMDVGINEKWFDRNFTDKIHLPGTLCDAGYGNACSLQPAMEKEIFLNLKRKHDYVGVAWYQKTIDIPGSWEGKTILMNLERIIWNSQLWIDGKTVEQHNKSLITPHQFDLTQALTPGRHTLVLRIDNRKQHDISIRNLAHAYTNDTQTMWNGVIGRMTLKAEEKIRIETMILTPDVNTSKVHVKLRFKNDSQEKFNGKVIFHIRNKEGKALPSKEIEVSGDEIIFDYGIENPVLWDEFNPYLYQAVAELQTGKTIGKKTSVFGMRKLTNKDALLQINGRRLFLRGTLECCIFPLKGYPPMDKAGWEKVFNAAKEYGLNHIRFHSWCPPEAAFEVADEMGIYLQAELPLWELNIGNDRGTTDFLFAEADRMMKAYGNHPSFCFWSMGNELQGNFALLDSLMMSLKQQDPRHLYMTTTFTFEKGHGSWPEPNDDFWVSQWTKKGWVRGQGIFDDQPASFDKDYSVAVDSLPVPIITHEIGQYSVFPNLKEIDKYKGNLMPLNFIAVKNDLEKKGRLDQADDYLKASGKLAAILYKEEIERALKTPEFSGFQLLDLHDFPGQGTALVGLLDAFWESKGLITPEEFRNFCSPVVPLIRFEKATYTSNDTLFVRAEIANFGSGELKHILPVWKLANDRGEVVAEGKLPEQNVSIGNMNPVGEFSVPLSAITRAEHLTLSLSIQNTVYKNSWSIWVYPEKLPVIDNKDIVYTRDFEAAKRALTEGKKVLFNPDKKELKGLDGKFVQVFWSPVHFPNQPGTMGILCDPLHPALKDFPTEMHSDWQWWDICKNAKTLDMDSIGNISPIVRMVDNFYKNRNLGLIFEVRTGSGKLLFCSSDLSLDMDKRPVARQLLYSLSNYMQSDKFNPEKKVSFDQIEKYFRNIAKTEEKKKSIYD